MSYEFGVKLSLREIAFVFRLKDKDHRDNKEHAAEEEKVEEVNDVGV